MLCFNVQRIVGVHKTYSEKKFLQVSPPLRKLFYFEHFEILTVFYDIHYQWISINKALTSLVITFFFTFFILTSLV